MHSFSLWDGWPSGPAFSSLGPQTDIPMTYYSHEKDPNVLFITIALLVVLALMCGIAWFKSSMESRTYNKLTGAHTTAWDALWVELRVQDAPHKRP